MAIYIAGNEITITWVLEPTDTPLAAADYDIRYEESGLDATYTDAAVSNFVAPTAITAGSITYAFTPTKRGRHKVFLTTGTNLSYTVLDEKNFWVFANSPGSLPETCVFGALSYEPGLINFATSDSRGKAGWEDLGIYKVGYDGAELVLFAARYYGVEQGGAGRWLYYTTPELAAPIQAFDQTDLPNFPVGASTHLQHIEYSPTLGIWIIGTWNGQATWSCSGDPTVLGNWTYMGSLGWTGGNPNIQKIVWDPGMKCFSCAPQSVSATHTMKVSVNGTSWSEQTTQQDLGTGLGAVNEHLMEVWLRTKLNGSYETMFTQRERMIWRKVETGAGVLPTAAQNYFVVNESNGMIAGSGIHQIMNIATDGNQVVITHRAYMNASGVPNQAQGDVGWGILGNANQGWHYSDFGHNSSDNFTLLLYLRGEARPWMTFIENRGWRDFATINGPPLNPVTSGDSAPDLQVPTLEPWASFHAEWLLDPFYRPPEHGLVQNQSIYDARYDAESVWGIDGFYTVISESIISRTSEFIVFKRPSA